MTYTRPLVLPVRNNSHIFSGVGLDLIASGSKLFTDEMFWR
jgi:hypothetical protein